MQQRLGQSETLIHAFAKPSYRLAITAFEPDQAEQFHAALSDRESAQPAQSTIEMECGTGGVVAVDPQTFGKVADLAAGGDRAGGEAEDDAEPPLPQITPSRILISVVLPAPLGPNNPKISPRSVCSETRRRASIGAPPMRPER